MYGRSTAARIKSAVESMRRKQRLHEGDRSDVVLQMLDDATQGFTYDGWEGDARKQQRQWVYGRSTARRASTARWRACAESNTSTIEPGIVFSGTAGARPLRKRDFPGFPTA